MRACAVEMHFEDLERHDYATNSSELAARRCKHPRSNPALTLAVTFSDLCGHFAWQAQGSPRAAVVSSRLVLAGAALWTWWWYSDFVAGAVNHHVGHVCALVCAPECGSWLIRLIHPCFFLTLFGASCRDTCFFYLLHLYDCLTLLFFVLFCVLAFVARSSFVLNF